MSSCKSSSEYRTWAGMIQRCTNPNCHNYRNYGGRGISVCGRWRKFESFLLDVGIKPSTLHTLERRNNEGDYEPSNCYWATRGEQLRNTRRNIRITLDGKTQVLKDWAAQSGISYATVQGRLRRGWPIRDALTLPADMRVSCARYWRTRSLTVTQCKWGHPYPKNLCLKKIPSTGGVQKSCRECDRLRNKRRRLVEKEASLAAKR